MRPSTRVLIVGCGRVGRETAKLLLEKKCQVTGTTRSAVKAADLYSAGIQPLILDLNAGGGWPDLSPYELILLSPAPSEPGETGYETVYGNGIPNFMRHLDRTAAHPRVIYTSSTGVYDVRNGDWVDESTPTPVTTPRVKFLLAGEKAVLEASKPGMVLRLGGIYGRLSGRIVALKKEVLAIEGGENFANNIHIEDVARAVVFLFDHGNPGEIYLGVDREPIQRRDLYFWMADQLGVRRPVVKEAGTDRGAQNKRCRSEKLSRLGFRFQYPTFKEGYEAILREAKWK